MLDALDRVRATRCRMLSATAGSASCACSPSAGEEALRHLRRGAVDARGARRLVRTRSGVRWALVLANLQRGAVDEAEHWLELAMPGPGDGRGDAWSFVRSRRRGRRSLLARGLTEAGLRLWRQAVERLRGGRPRSDADDPSWSRGSWRSSRPRRGRPRPARPARPGRGARRRAAGPAAEASLTPPPSRRARRPRELPGLRLAPARPGHGGPRPRARRARRVRMIALAERFGCARIPADHVRRPAPGRRAEQADRPAYADAVSSYAGLDRRAASCGAAALRRVISAPGPG